MPSLEERIANHTLTKKESENLYKQINDNANDLYNIYKKAKRDGLPNDQIEKHLQAWEYVNDQCIDLDVILFALNTQEINKLKKEFDKINESVKEAKEDLAKIAKVIETIADVADKVQEVVEAVT